MGMQGRDPPCVIRAYACAEMIPARMSRGGNNARNASSGLEGRMGHGESILTVPPVG